MPSNSMAFSLLVSVSLYTSLNLGAYITTRSLTSMSSSTIRFMSFGRLSILDWITSRSVSSATSSIPHSLRIFSGFLSEVPDGRLSVGTFWPVRFRTSEAVTSFLTCSSPSTLIVLRFSSYVSVDCSGWNCWLSIMTSCTSLSSLTV